MQSKRKIGALTRKNSRRQLVWFPALQLAGQWMTQAGFQIGQQVTVTIDNGKITIQ